MTELIMNTLDYWVMWHFSLAILAFMLFYRYFFNKQLAMVCTIALTFVWEIFDSIFLGDSLKNSLIDWGTTLIAVFIITLILLNRKIEMEK